MTLVGLLILILVGAICGGIAEAIVGYSPGGFLASVAIGFLGAPGRVPALARHFDRGPYPVGGDGNTVFATGGGVTAEASTAVIGPPFRFIADLSDLSRCYGLLAPGNSGRPDSPHYDDQVEAWFKGKYHPMLYSGRRGAWHTAAKLTSSAALGPTRK